MSTLTIPELFRLMPARYRAGLLGSPRTYSLTVGDFKCTVALTPQECRVEEGRLAELSDVFLKTTPALFQRLVVSGKAPGGLDIARGLFKTNHPAQLEDLCRLFDFTA